MQMRRIRLNQRLDELIAIAERVRLPVHQRPRQLILIVGGLSDQQRIGHTVGAFFIRGGLPPLPYPPSDRELLRDARQRLTNALVGRINTLATAGSLLVEQPVADIGD
jgi:hypothetical protein